MTGVSLGEWQPNTAQPILIFGKETFKPGNGLGGDAEGMSFAISIATWLYGSWREDLMSLFPGSTTQDATKAALEAMLRCGAVIEGRKDAIMNPGNIMKAVADEIRDLPVLLPLQVLAGISHIRRAESNLSLQSRILDFLTSVAMIFSIEELGTHGVFWLTSPASCKGEVLGSLHHGLRKYIALASENQSSFSEEQEGQGFHSDTMRLAQEKLQYFQSKFQGLANVPEILDQPRLESLVETFRMYLLVGGPDHVATTSEKSGWLVVDGSVRNSAGVSC